MTPARVVLLCCGSFNPITNMHLRMFEIARDALHKTGRYRVIGGIVSPVSDGYGKKELLPAKHRCAMVERALKTTDWIRMDTWECDQSTWSETVKILRHHREKLDSKYNTSHGTPNKKRKLGRNNSPDDLDYNDHHQNVRNLNESGGPVHLKLLCGGDLLESFATPGLWKPDDMEEIVSRYGLVVISRSGSDPEKFIYETDMLCKYQNNIHLVTEWISNEISSTRIRRALRRGDSVKYLLQDSVIDYIQANQLYGAGDNKLMNYNIITPSPNNDDAEEDTPSSPTPSPSLEGHIRYLSPQHYHSDDAILQDYTNTGIRRFRRMHNRNFHSDDSDDSIDRSPPLPRRPITCMGADISGLMRRVKNMRVAVTPETCV